MISSYFIIILLHKNCQMPFCQCSGISYFLSILFSISSMLSSRKIGNFLSDNFFCLSCKLLFYLILLSIHFEWIDWSYIFSISIQVSFNGGERFKFHKFRILNPLLLEIKKQENAINFVYPKTTCLSGKVNPLT